MESTAAAPRRRLSLLDTIALGLNGIVGSGVYVLLAPLAAVAGAWSMPGIVVCAAACALVALCFAELSSRYDASGGAFLYAELAFGRGVGFVIGWMSLATGVLSFATGAAAFGHAGSAVMSGLGFEGLGPTRATVASVVLIALLAVVNVVGVKAGARVLDVLTAFKLVPLLLLAVMSVPLWSASQVLPDFATADGHAASVTLRAAFLAVFMFSGFEFVPVPAGEATHARRDIPRAILFSLGAASVLYLCLQASVLSVVSGVGETTQPLAALARSVWGTRGGLFIAIASMLSMAGFCAGSTLVAPRYATALGERGLLPSFLSRRSARFGTPTISIALTSVLAVALVLSRELSRLLDITTLVMFAQYLPACLAVPVLRKAGGANFLVPGGRFVVPLLATTACGVLLVAAGVRAEEWLFAGGLLIVGLGVLGIWQIGRRLRTAG